LLAVEEVSGRVRLGPPLPSRARDADLGEVAISAPRGCDDWARECIVLSARLISSWAAAGVVASVASVIASTSEARSVADETSFTAASSAVRRSAIISGLEHGGPRGARVAAQKPERERGGVAKRRWRAGPGESSEELEAARALRVVECDGDDGAESTSVRIESGVPRGVHCGVCSPAAPPPAPPAPAPPWGKEGLVRKEETEEPNE